MTEETSAVMPLRKAAPSFAWEGVDRLPYKEADAAPFKNLAPDPWPKVRELLKAA